MTRPTDTSAVPYQGKPLYAVPDDLVHLDVLDINATDERLWVPQSKDVWFRPLLFNTSQGYFVNLLRVRKSGILSRHRHAGPVHATTLKGRWHYLEHDWWAEEGSYAFEPPGDIHTLEVPEGVEEMITMFHVTGAYIYVDPQGKPEAVEDVFSKIDLARAHFEKVSLILDDVTGPRLIWTRSASVPTSSINSSDKPMTSSAEISHCTIYTPRMHPFLHESTTIILLAYTDFRRLSE